MTTYELQLNDEIAACGGQVFKVVRQDYELRSSGKTTLVLHLENKSTGARSMWDNEDFPLHWDSITRDGKVIWEG